MKKTVAIILSTVLCCCVHSVCRAADKAEGIPAPTGTYCYAQKDGNSLFLDYYAPAEGSQTTYKGKEKPTVLFMFGGGFMSGARNEKGYVRYYRMLCEEGYGVVAIDYRLGMKDAEVKSMVSSFSAFYDAIFLAVEDLFSATAFLIEHKDEVGIDPFNIVLAGSSAGAIMTLHGLWETDRHSSYADVLPEGYRYKGAMSFAGGLIFKDGSPRFSSGLCPVLLFQGTSDKVVQYKKLQFFKIGFYGTDAISKRLDKASVPHMVYRYESNGHEIAGIMERTVELQDFYLKNCVMEGKEINLDAMVSDPTIKKFRLKNTSELYKKK